MKNVDNITNLFSIELIEDNEGGEDSTEVFYRVNGVAMVGGTANVGRGAGSYVSENLLGAHEDARSALASLVGGEVGFADPGFCATHKGMDFISWEAHVDNYILTVDGIPALMRIYDGALSDVVDSVVKRYLFHMYNAKSDVAVFINPIRFAYIILHDETMFVKIDSRIIAKEKLRFSLDREIEPPLDTPEWREWIHNSIVTGVKTILNRLEREGRI